MCFWCEFERKVEVFFFCFGGLAEVNNLGRAWTESKPILPLVLVLTVIFEEDSKQTDHGFHCCAP